MVRMPFRMLLTVKALDIGVGCRLDQSAGFAQQAACFVSVHLEMAAFFLWVAGFFRHHAPPAPTA
jgi:hypothetical protein